MFESYLPEFLKGKNTFLFNCIEPEDVSTTHLPRKSSMRCTWIHSCQSRNQLFKSQLIRTVYAKWSENNQTPTSLTEIQLYLDIHVRFKHPSQHLKAWQKQLRNCYFIENSRQMCQSNYTPASSGRKSRNNRARGMRFWQRHQQQQPSGGKSYTIDFKIKTLDLLDKVCRKVKSEKFPLKADCVFEEFKLLRNKKALNMTWENKPCQSSWSYKQDDT